MLYVGSHKKENGVDYFGVTDTDDMVTEIVTKSQLWNIVNKQGVRIEGVVDNKVVLLSPVFDSAGVVIGVESKSKKSRLQGKAGDAPTFGNIETRKQSILQFLKKFNLLYHGPEPERFVFDETYTRLIGFNPRGDETVIHIPFVKVIGAHCFEKLEEKLKHNDFVKFILPSSVEMIEEYAFYCCCVDSKSELHTENVSVIGKYAFANLRSDGVKFSFPNVERIGEYAFAVGVGDRDDVYDFGVCIIDTIELGDKLTVIPESMCDDCLGLRHIRFGRSIKSIGKYAFRWCDSLMSLDFPDSLVEIGESAFEGYETEYDPSMHGKSCFDVVIPSSVQTIRDCAFMRNYAIRSCTGFERVPNKGVDVFKNCESLATAIQ